MPNDVMLFNRELPAHLRATADDALNAVAAAGIGAANISPRISIRGGRFHLVDREGNETDPIIVNDKGMAEVENHGVMMDMVIVGALPHISKIYYDQKYDPNVEAQPACFSDNGTAPSDRAAKPQARTCAECSKNVWGSDVNPSTGKARQACANTKKLAVVRYHDESNTVYTLALPGASLKAYENAVKVVAQHGAKVGGIIWRVSFDTKEAFPKLIFNGVGYLDEETMADFLQIQQTDEVKFAVGADDRPASPEQVAARQGAPALAAPQPKTETVTAPGGFVVRPRPGETAAQVVAATPVSTAPVHVPTPPGMPDHTRAAMAQQPAQMPIPDRVPPTPPAPTAQPAAAFKKRGRRSNAEIQAAALATAAAPLPPSKPVLSAEGQDAARAEADEKARYEEWKASQQPAAVTTTPAAQTDPAWDRQTDIMPPLPRGLDKRGPSVEQLPPTSPEVDDAMSRAMGIEV